MTREEMIAAVDGEISRLSQIHALLSQSNTGRFSVAAAAAPASAVKGKRTMSPEARKRIAQAQKKRWAKQKRDAAASA